jgi:outer membrane immunogenic protein
MRLSWSFPVFTLLLLGTAPAAAADRPFTGFYAGPEIGLHEHHIFIEQQNPVTGGIAGRYHRGWGVGGGAFAGYDLAALERLRLGIEGGMSVGGNGPVARFSDGTYYTQRPRYGFFLTGRVGYVLGRRMLAYGTLGYGGHKYKPRGTAQVAGVKEWGSSFTIGGGIEYRVSERVGVRIDFRHLDNQMSHLLIGIPIRF